jgi:hypothetical protein
VKLGCVNLGEKHTLRVCVRLLSWWEYLCVKGGGTGGWRKLHNEELHNLYFSTDVITCRMIKSRKMRWEVHVA